MLPIFKVTLVIFCGPPCSGKTILASQLASRSKIRHLQMDRIRERIRPGSSHGRVEIDIAYRQMHAECARFLEMGVDIIADSTYGRYEQRADLESISQRYQARLLIVQCRVEPTEAVKRFCERAAGHPALDLTEDRVRLLAERYPYAPSGLLIDTHTDVSQCMKRIVAYLDSGSSVLPGEWSMSARETSWPGPEG